MKAYKVEYGIANDYVTVKEWNEICVIGADNAHEAVVQALTIVETEKEEKDVLKQVLRKGIEKVLFRVTDMDDPNGEYEIVHMSD